MRTVKSEVIDGVPTITGTADNIISAIKEASDKIMRDGRQIIKAKLTPLNYLDVDYTETLELTDDSIKCEKSQKCFWDVHPDLKRQFDRLIPHMALLCELLERSQMNYEDGAFTHDSLNKYKVTGYVIGGSDEHEGVTIIGRKMLAHNRILNLVTPFTKWEDEHSGYAYAIELQAIIADCEYEVLAYLNGKRAPSSQQELPFEETQKNNA